MTIKIRQVWYNINKVLTIINFFLVGIITFGNIPKKYQDKQMPFIANIVLLLLLGLVLFSYTL